jgi:adenosylhomocysteine nucleosidase
VDAGKIAPPEPVIGVVCALHREVAPFLERCHRYKTESGNDFTFRGCGLDGTHICIVEGGTGLQRARQATNALIDAFQPTWILSVGFSGALREGIGIGDIVIANGVTDHTGRQRLAIDVGMQPDRGLHVGHLCTTDHIVRLISEKRELAAATGAIAVDMESFGVAQVCQERRTRFMAVRSISDDLKADLPPEVLAILGPKGTVRAGALFGSLLSRPNFMKDLWRMREQAQRAADQLGKVLPDIVRQLAQSGHQAERE